MRGRKFAVLFLLTGVLQGELSVAACAQTPSQRDQIIRQQEQILRQQEERFRPEDPLIPKELPPGYEKPVPPNKTGGSTKYPCFNIQRIEIDGWEADLRPLISQFEMQCINKADIDKMLELLTDHFVENGYVTTRAYVPAQDLSSGILTLTVIEGKVENIKPSTPNVLSNGQIVTAFPGLEKQRLNLRDFEQGLDQINRLPNSSATVEFEPGSKQGQSIAVIDNTIDKSWRVSAGLDNSGSEATGELQQTYSGEAYNWLGFNDLLSLSYGQDTEPASSLKASRNKTGFFSVPYGYWLLSLSANYFEYRNQIEGTVQDFKSSGTSTTWRADLARVLHRDQTSKTTLSSSFTHKKTKNYIEDVLLEVSSRRLTILGLNINHSRRLGPGLVSASVGYEAGIKALGAKQDDDRAQDSPEAQFEKYTADLTVIQNFEVLETPFTVTSGMRGQWSPDTLYGNERISIGSLGTVRGYKESSVSGDTGGFIRNELALRFPISSPQLSQIASEIQPFVGFDYGVISQDASELFEGGRISGWSAGFKVRGPYLNLALTYARPIDAPSFVNRRNSEIYFSANLAF
ncbi:MAG: ShlB/FhaC/HecB family hemolysin secretion/activation protein [Rhodospirillales bacterium]|nr:ShlB/FhaC/HecB family hemolysin secretion/activation protein [Rhodospirillales bacterium]MBR9817455.1 ShlB/FhaC/HecB family hemolysin secretion/activation protein [Rhodospirillales bacterium]